MAIKFDQTGLTAGIIGYSRTDGRPTGDFVTITRVSTDPGRVQLVWTPPEDTTALTTFNQTGPDQWSFTPTPNVYGEYSIEEITNEGLPNESRQRRVFGIRYPQSGLLPPALNSTADQNATILNVSSQTRSRSDNNAIDFASSRLNLYNFAGWLRNILELFAFCEQVAAWIVSLFAATKTVATVNDLRALTDTTYSLVHVLAHTTENDGGEGTFQRKPVGSFVDNDGTHIVAGLNCWVRVGANPYNVKSAHFGVSSTRADNTLALNRAVAYMQDGAVFDLRGRGSLDITDTIDFRNRRFIEIRGSNTTINAKVGSNFTNKPLVNMIGASHIDMYDLRVHSELTTNVPACCLAVGRTAVNQGGNIRTFGCYFRGKCTGAPFYTMCAENSTYFHTTFEGVECPALLDASDDPLALCGVGYIPSNYGKKFVACTFDSLANGSTCIVRLQGAHRCIEFEGGYFHSNGTALRAIECVMGAVPNAATHTIRNLVVKNIRTSQPTGWVTTYIGKTAIDVHHSGTTTSTSEQGRAIIEVAALASMSFSNIDEMFVHGISCPVILSTSLIEGSPAVTQNKIAVANAGSIQIDSGAFTLNEVTSLSQDPMAGTGWIPTSAHGNVFTVLELGTFSKSRRIGGVQSNRWVTITGATPSVSGSSVLILDQPGVTPVNVTDFIDGFPGQRIIVYSPDGLSTIVNSATIQNRNGMDLTIAANDFAEYVRAPNDTAWLQVGFAGQQPHWRRFVAIDFTTLETQTITANGAIVIGGQQFYVENFANLFAGHTAPYGIVNGQGLRIPDQASGMAIEGALQNRTLPMLSWRLPTTMTNVMGVRFMIQLGPSSSNTDGFTLVGMDTWVSGYNTWDKYLRVTTNTTGVEVLTMEHGIVANSQRTSSSNNWITAVGNTMVGLEFLPGRFQPNTFDGSILTANFASVAAANIDMAASWGKMNIPAYEQLRFQVTDLSKWEVSIRGGHFTPVVGGYTTVKGLIIELYY